jgi:hypothetical protein
MALFGKRIKPLGFQYKPQYFDPEREERAARLKAAQEATAGDTESIKARISAGFKGPRRTQSNAYKSAKRRSNITVIITLGVLLILVYILLTQFLPQIENMLE